MDVRRRLEPRRARHLHVEEDDVVRELARQLDRLGGARRLTDDLHVRVRLEQVAELRARRRLVVDEQRAHRHYGHLEPDDRAERERAQLHALTVVRGEAEIDVGEADPGAFPHAGLEHALDRVARDAAAVVAHRHAQPAAPQPRTDEQVERAVGLAVLDRVLDERLHEQRRQAHAERVGRCVDGHAKLRPEPRLLELEVALHVPQLVFERDELARAREPAAQMIGEREHEPPRALRLGADERRDRVQRVEDEVRLHLRLQRGRRRGVELRQLQLRREVAADLLERLDRHLVERRAGVAYATSAPTGPSCRRSGTTAAAPSGHAGFSHSVRMPSGARSGTSRAVASYTGRIGRSPAPWWSAPAPTNASTCCRSVTATAP